MDGRQVEFAGDEWFDLFRRRLHEVIPAMGSALEGVTFSICEIATDPPEHLADPGTNRVAWWFRIDGPTVEVGRGARDDVANRSEGDYSAVLTAARTVYADDPRTLDKQRRRRSSAVRRGRATPLVVPPELEETLLELHDFLARRTC
ncbi:MAG TPA: hypothetical protein VK611_12025 [Acidimicrobiales bacterium]|nr:hypothetical protein [Acidimicrobiales bacterium]